MKNYKIEKFIEKTLKAYGIDTWISKEHYGNLESRYNYQHDVSEYTVSTESQEVTIQAEIADANNASKKAKKTPFRSEEAALLDKIEKAAADNILLQHGNHKAAHQVTLDR